MLRADDGEHRHDDRQAPAAIQPALDVQQLPESGGDLLPPHDGGGEDRLGGLRTAPMRNDSAQGSPTIQRARSAVPTSVSGRPRRSARPGRRQADARSLSPAASRR